MLSRKRNSMDDILYNYVISLNIPLPTDMLNARNYFKSDKEE